MTTTTKTAAPRAWNYHQPETEYSPVVAHNRMALALGGLRNAAAGEGADYNGHRYNVIPTIHGYSCGYMWAGWKVVHRGPKVLECAQYAVDFVRRAAARGQLGNSIGVEVSAEHMSPELDAALLALGLTPGAAPKHPTWWTWRHEVARRTAPDSADRMRTSLGVRFHLDLLESCDSEESYVNAARLREKG